MGATVSEIAGGPLDPPPSLVKGVGSKRLSKGRVKIVFDLFNSMTKSSLETCILPFIVTGMIISNLHGLGE